jgi:hypothetical protein
MGHFSCRGRGVSFGNYLLGSSRPMASLLRSTLALNPDCETEPSFGIVEYPEVASWWANEQRKKKEEAAERRRVRLGRVVVKLAVALLGEEERDRFEREASLASEVELKAWKRRAHYASTWPEIVGSSPVEGLRFVSCERLLEHAIDKPLNCWCVLLLFTPSRNEELDYDRVQFGAPWVREGWHVLSGVVDELRRYQRALVACSSERLARGIAATTNTPKEKRLWARIYGPSGSSSYGVGKL